MPAPSGLLRSARNDAPFARNDQRSRGACAPEFCQSHSKFPRENRGERSAERRISTMSAPHARGVAANGVLGARCAPCRQGANDALICLRGALAFRRSTAALAGILRSGSAPGQASWDVVGAGVTRPFLSQSRVAPPAPVVVPASVMPEAARERIASPRAGTALAPSCGLPSGRRPRMSEVC